MASQRAWATSGRVVSGVSATLLTAAAALYAPIALGEDPLLGMTIRTHVIWSVVLVAAASTWMLALLPHRSTPRLVSAFTGGFSGLWIFSFIGPPVVVASLVAIVMSGVGVPRRLTVAVVALAIVGFGVGLVVLRMTQPPG